MKFIMQVVVIAVLAYLLELLLPWWSIAIAAFAGGTLLKTRANFLAGFLGIGLLWLIAALLNENDAAAPLTDRVALIFKVSKPVLLFIMSVIGGLAGGFAAMTGALLRKEKRRSYYY